VIILSKVDWITWKTNTDEIIDPLKVKEKIQDYFNNYNTYMNSVVYEGINYEISRGGLDTESLNIAGSSPANEIAKEILNKIDEVKSNSLNLIDNIYESLKLQREIEKKQLITAIEEKISEEEKILDKTIETKDKIINSNLHELTKELDDSIDYTYVRIKRLKERLEAAKSL
jgi:hypothetical protein